ncbi:hypothetical protein DPX16_13665 [Anabarilius grahami]|uniref:Uncharacterized protein n=1 Tax=Anabarilius grahami TaxID=495550 RepID=A0A3N0XTY1_ANAGA|nr:hypothetical protein DPX16_13665 [Anabarilius grahami]
MKRNSRKIKHNTQLISDGWTSGRTCLLCLMAHLNTAGRQRMLRQQELPLKCAPRSHGAKDSDGLKTGVLMEIAQDRHTQQYAPTSTLSRLISNPKRHE